MAIIAISRQVAALGDEIATAVAALEVQCKGAIPAMPYRENVFKFLEEKGFKYE